MRRYVPSFLLTFLFISLLLYLVPPRELVDSLKGIGASNLILAFCLYTLSQITRSLRWKKVMRTLSLWEIFLINSANIFLNNLLPARTGELSWFYYSKRLGVELKVSLWAFLLGRAYDLLGLLSVVIFSYAFAERSWKVLGLLILLLVLSVLSPLLREVLPRGGRLAGLKDFLRKELSPSLSLWLFSLSFLSFALKSLSVYLLTTSFDLFSFTLAFAGGELTSVLPFHSFMGYGTYETGFLIPLKVLGAQVKEALRLGFVVHSFLLLSSAVWGLLSIGLLHTLSRRSP